MQNPLANVDWKTVSVKRLLLIALLLFLAWMVLWGLWGMMQQITGVNSVKSMPAPNAPSYDSMAGSNVMVQGTTDLGYGSAERAIAPPVPSTSVGGDAESYESISYSASIKTAQLARVCDTIESWKPLSYVVFTRAVRGDTSCSYAFKVERASAEGVLAQLRALKPYELTGDIQTIKKQLVQYEGELAILQQRQQLLTDTLAQANDAYNKLMTLAEDANNVDALSKVIDSKLSQIERLSKSKIDLSGQIDSLVRRQSELADKLEYAYFSVSVEKYELVSTQGIKDSWMNALRRFSSDVNTFLENLTLGLLHNLLSFALVVVYLMLGLVIAKYGWRAAKRMWQSPS